ncbi:MAG: DUF2520 domain-containing protein [Candidatus Aminicenantes bacterium]|nr:DUF2520 domain-containing protein [Candidatus Aminicenantes bacterium]
MKRFSVIGVGCVGANLIHSLVQKGYQLKGVAPPPVWVRARTGRTNEGPGKHITAPLDKKARIFNALLQSLAAHPGLENSASYIKEDIASMVEASDFVFITTQESRIKEAAGLIAKQAAPAGKIFFHTSNSLTAAELREIKEQGGLTASFSPLQTFADFDPGIDLFAGIYFLTEGDAPALALGREIAAALGAKALVVDAAEKPLLHMAAVSSSNFLISVLKFAEGRIKRCRGDFDIGIMLPLIEQTLKNVEKKGVDASLTGPLQRGEAGILRKHLALLEGEDAAFYKTLSEYLNPTAWGSV